MSYIKKHLIKSFLILTLITASFSLILPTAKAQSLDLLCQPIGCKTFGGPVLALIFIPFCGPVIAVGLPNPITAIYPFAPNNNYRFNHPIPVPPGRSGAQNVVGQANLFNPNLLCPLPIVVRSGTSFPRP